MVKTLSANLICLVFLLFFSPIVKAQDSIIDTLIVQLQSATDTNEVIILNQLSAEMARIDLDNALSYAQQALERAKKINYEAGAAKALQRISVAYYYKSDYSLAEEYSLMALEIFEKLGDEQGIASCRGNMGSMLADQGFYPEAMEYYLESLSSFEKLGNISAMAISHNLIANLYYYQNDFDNALIYYRNSLELNDSIGNEYGIFNDYNNLGLIHIELDNHAEALDYFIRSIQLNDGRDMMALANATSNTGMLYLVMEEYENALAYSLDALELYEGIGNNYDASKTMYHIARSYFELGRSSEAYTWFMKSLELGKDVRNLSSIGDAYNGLAMMYAQQGNYKAAYEIFGLHTMYNDSLINQERTRQIAELEKRYESAKKESQIQELRDQQTIQNLELERSENIRLFFIVISLLTILLAFFAFRQYRIKRRANLILQEKNRLEVANKLKVLDLLGQQVSKDIAEELIKDTSVLKSQRKYVCVMFLDIREFTPFAEKRTPEEIIAYQNDVFGFMVNIVNNYHGIINQFIGDGFMATFGVPISHDNDSLNAVQAALEISGQLNELNRSGQIPQTRIGIGLHSGYVVTGNVGTDTRKQFTITGNTVILASRIEQLNKKFNSEVLISDEVMQHLDPEAFNHESLGAVSVKGRVEPINIIRLA